MERRLFLKMVAVACALASVDSAAAPADPPRSRHIPDEILLTVVAIAQPTCLETVADIIADSFPEYGKPDYKSIIASIGNLLKLNRVLQVSLEPHPLFSLTAAGQDSLPVEMRRKRDMARIFLMERRSSAIVRSSRGDGNRKVGAPPTANVRTDTELPPTRQQGNSQSLTCPSFGNRPAPRDTLPRFLSFVNLAQINTALGNPDATAPLSFDGFVLCLGLSPALLDFFIKNPSRNYREFTIPKKSGGLRLIASPRVFLKTTQRVVLDFFLRDLRIHDAVHSYRSGRSPVTNAYQHAGQEYVGSTDIKDFFGSISIGMIFSCLIENGFDPILARRLSMLCTRHGVLPQGAPTSPALSNAVLFSFDEGMRKSCQQRNLQYSRYADDITLSGRDRPGLCAALSIAERELRLGHGMSINARKTRIAPRHTQQRVTGVVVNVAAAPPRKKRRRIRALFHQAQWNSEIPPTEARVLAGHLGYLRTFPSQEYTNSVKRYQSVLSGNSDYAKT